MGKMAKGKRVRETPPKFCTAATVPIPRFPKTSVMVSQPIVRNVSKPHIFYDPRWRKWTCGNFYAKYRANSPVYAYRGFVRAVKAKAEGYY